MLAASRNLNLRSLLAGYRPLPGAVDELMTPSGEIRSHWLPVLAEMEPPKGTVYNYPLRPHHDAEYYIVASSGPPEVGVQIWSQSMIPGMVARMVTGQTAKQVIDWAKRELEGIRR